MIFAMPLQNNDDGQRKKHGRKGVIQPPVQTTADDYVVLATNKAMIISIIAARSVT